MAGKPKKQQKVETLTHDEASRRNIPTAEFQSVMSDEDKIPIRIAYERRNRDLDPQLVWRGKDGQDESDLVVQAPPLYIQEKVHPKALIDDLQRISKDRAPDDGETTLDLFADFNGISPEADKTEFYQHDQNWTNRMILGDSLQVMSSLAEREGLRGKVQCIYIDPPYGIKFNSNFQWSTTSRDVKDGKVGHITREPEQVKAFRDTWRDGIHSYLTYLRDRLTVARDLLAESGSVFVQIGDENVHRVRMLMDEIFGPGQFVSLISYRTSSGTTQQSSVKRVFDYIVWYCRNLDASKFRRMLAEKAIDSGMYNQLELRNGIRRSMTAEEKANPDTVPSGVRIYRKLPLHSMGSGDQEARVFRKTSWRIPSTSHWRYAPDGFSRLVKADRVQADKTALSVVYYHDDYPASEITNSWTDTGPEINKQYIVQTAIPPIARCILMTTDPGDLVLDPTCGSGTTAYVAEQWGRRWITCDTSRVALALARARIMGARYPFYLLADSREGQAKEAEITGSHPSSQPVYGSIRQGFVYQRVPHITLKSIANNAEIDVIYQEWQTKLEPLREALNTEVGESWEEWEIPREPVDAWPANAKALHSGWWDGRIARQKEIDACIAANADFEYLYDKPCEARKIVRVAGPFTVESLSPHRMLGVDENGELIDNKVKDDTGYAAGQSFPEMILENLRTAGVQQAHKEDRILFTSLIAWPGDLVCAEGCYLEGQTDRRAAICIGPEFGTMQRADLVRAAREAAEAGFDVLVACAFNYEAHAAEFDKLGRIPILKARMNADLHMAKDLKNTGHGNLFVIFGEPDIDLISEEQGRMRVKVKGVDVFKPQTGEVVSDEADNIACWFIDTDYNEESFFVRHAYFLGASDPYKALRITLKAEIDAEAWETLHSDLSRPFDKPKSGRIAVKVINHLGDEVMKVFGV